MLLLAERINKLGIGWNERPLGESDLYRICRAFRIQIEEMPLRVEGFYFRVAGRDLIAVDSRLAAERRLLVLFHELGHYLFHTPYSGAAAGFHHVGGRTRDEIEADIFAVCAVLPRPMIESRSHVELLADGFDPDTVKLRLDILASHAV